MEEKTVFEKMRTKNIRYTKHFENFLNNISGNKFRLTCPAQGGMYLGGDAEFKFRPRSPELRRLDRLSVFPPESQETFFILFVSFVDFFAHCFEICLTDA